MPYEITTKDGITIQNIPDHIPADAPELRERVARIRAQGAFTAGGEGQPAAPAAPAPPQAPQAPQEAAPRTTAEQLGLGMRHVLSGTVAPLYDIAAIPQNLLSNIPGLGFLRVDSGGLMTNLGLPEPRDAGERLMGAGISGAAGAITPMGIGRAVQTMAAPAAQRLAQVLQAAPAQQVAMGTTGGLGSQIAQEAVGEEAGPVAKGVAGIAGGLAGGAIPAATAGLARRTFGTVAPAPGVPTAEQVRKTAKDAYKAADEAGVVFTPGAMRRVADDVIDKLSDFGFNAGNQPQTANVLKEIDRLQESVVSFKEVENLRKMAGRAGSFQNPSDKAAARLIVESIDDMVASPRIGNTLTQHDVIAGDAAKAASAIETAREAWSRLAKNKVIEKAIERGIANAETAGSGANTENAVRQALKSVYLNEQKTRGFTADEREALRKVVYGGPIQNLLRYAGKAAPTGIVSGTLGGGIGFALGGPAGAAAIAGGGYLAKRAADQMARERAQRLQDIILSGGRASNLPPASTPRGNIPALINILQQGVSP